MTDKTVAQVTPVVKKKDTKDKKPMGFKPITTQQDVEALAVVDNIIGVLKLDSPGAVPSPLKMGEEFSARFRELRNSYNHRGFHDLTGENTPIISKIATGEQAIDLKEFSKVTNGVYVLGLRLLPVHSVTIPNRKQSPGFGFNAVEPKFGGYHFNYRLSDVSLPEGEELDIYQFELGGEVFSVMLDKTSKVWIDNDTTSQKNTMWDNDHGQSFEKLKGGGAVVYKSELVNTCFLGSCTFYGGNFVDCLFMNSSVNQLSKNSNPGDMFIPSVKKFDEPTVDVCLDRSHITRAKLPRGRYSHVNFTDVTLESRHFVRVSGTNIDSSTVKGNETLFIAHSNIRNSTITGTSIELANQTLRDTYMRNEFIYATNKLAISVFDVPHVRFREIKLVRINRQEMELDTNSNNQKVKFALDLDLYEIKDLITEHLTKALATEVYDGPEKTKMSDDPLMNSIRSYLVDNIMSRVKIIRSIDSAVEVGNEIENPNSTKHIRGRYYGPF